ncbi:MAG: DEAD/DEAH box helicase [Nanoarchaeota archaeon]|nr:DEAD/DEAH box helicase [Nanoarchaeota archaeon]
MEKFEKLLGKDSPLLVPIKNKGFEVPTEIQEKSLPDVLKGKDVIAGASTGSGKTLVFAVGLLKNIKKGFGIQGLVLTPTRELAEQITKELLEFSKQKNLNIVSVYGGVPIHRQIKAIPESEIVVGTPGRILDHIERNSIDFTQINTLVLDEADRMLDMGFIDDVEKIIGSCSKKRQTLLFSATITQDVIHLAQKYMENPIEISAEPQVDPNKLKQVYYDVDDNMKYSLLTHLLENEKSGLVIIFCNTRKNVDFVANNLKFSGIEAVPIHGGFSQEKRDRMLESFHSKKVHVLVATDVAARGLDIKGVSHIYNFDTPISKDDYIHRIGRTARAGEQGKVINIIASRDYKNFPQIESNIKITLEKTPLIKRVRIRWMPETRQRREFRKSRSGGENRRDDGRQSGGRSWGGSRGSSWGRGRSDSGSRGGDRTPSRGRTWGGSRDGNRTPSRGNSWGRSSGGQSRSGGSRDSDRGHGSSSWGRSKSGGGSRGGGDRTPSRGRSWGGDDDRESRGRSSGGSNSRSRDGGSRDGDRRQSRGKDSGFRGRNRTRR